MIINPGIAWLVSPFACFLLATCSSSLFYTSNLSSSSIDWMNIDKQAIASSCSHLDLSFNNLHGEIPNGAFNLFKLLKVLDLKKNKITALNDHSFYYHVTINSSFLKSNWFEWKPLNLERLDVSYNEFKILTSTWLNGIISTLKYLDIRNNNIIDISEKFLYTSDLKFLQLELSNNPLNCMQVVWLRNVSNKKINLTCFIYKSTLRNAIVQVPISSNSSIIESDSRSYFHNLSTKSIPIQEFLSDDYLFNTKSVMSRFELTCSYQGDLWPTIVWFHGNKAIEKALEPRLFHISETFKKHGQFDSTLIGWTEKFALNLTCKFFRQQTTSELNRVLFYVQNRKNTPVLQITPAIETKDHLNTSHLLTKEISTGFFITISLLVVASIISVLTLFVFCLLVLELMIFFNIIFSF